MLRGLITLAACVSTLGAAPIISMHPLDLLAEADALIVGRVARVDKGSEVLPPEGRTWPRPVYEHVAEVELLRFHAAGRELREQLDGRRTVSIGYKAENPLSQGGVFGGPLWPAIRVGEVRVFGVRNSAEGFRLWFEEGLGAVPPAQEALLHDLPAEDGVAFLERELTNGLAAGDAKAAFEAARYAQRAFFGSHDSAKDRRPALEQRVVDMLGGDLSRTRIAAAALLASQGFAQPSLAHLRAGRPPQGAVFTTYFWLLKRTLELLPEENADALIIETLLDDLPALHWSAVVNEYARHPALDAPLAAAIAQRKPGVLPLLEALVRNGRRDLTPSALTLLREQITAPDPSTNDWSPAGRLALNHGSDEDFTLFLALILRAQAQDLELYRALWNAGAYDETAPRSRMLRFFALFLPDRREAFGGIRFADLVANRLAALSGESFGLDQQRQLSDTPLAARDGAIAQAADWLAAAIVTAP